MVNEISLFQTYAALFCVMMVVAFFLSCLLVFFFALRSLYEFFILRRGLTGVISFGRTNTMTQDEFKKGMTVDVERRSGDLFNYDFRGNVIGYHDGYVIVEDMEGECFDCEPDQLTIPNEEN